MERASMDNAPFEIPICNRGERAVALGGGVSHLGRLVQRCRCFVTGDNGVFLRRQ